MENTTGNTMATPTSISGNLRWILQQGVVAIPMTTKRENMLSNIRALDFELSVDDMAAISAIGTRQGRTINPSWMAGRWEP